MTCFNNLPSIKRWTAGTTLSNRRQRRGSNFSKCESLSNGAGKSKVCGSLWSKIIFHSSVFSSNASFIPCWQQYKYNKNFPKLKDELWKELTWVFIQFQRTWKLGISFKRQISSQDLTGSHFAGLGWGFSSPTPPVRKNIHWELDIFPCLLSKLTRRMREKSSLSFSNNERQMFTYKEYVKDFVKSSRRCRTSSTAGVLSIVLLKRFTNHTSEYWYIGSMFANVTWK